MEIKDKYNNWSGSYDNDKNLTRDLDERVMSETFNNKRFGSILEIGCGTGKNTAFLSEIGEKVCSVDFSERMIDKAREKISKTNVLFSIADINEKWDFKDDSFDLITSNLVLEHVGNLNHIFSEAKRMLGENGRFFICELHPYRQYQGKKAEFNNGKETTQIPAYLHNISEFTNSAKKNGFSLLELNEWWHKNDQKKNPRLISFMFR